MDNHVSSLYTLSHWSRAGLLENDFLGQKNRVRSWFFRPVISRSLSTSQVCRLFRRQRHFSSFFFQSQLIYHSHTSAGLDSWFCWGLMCFSRQVGQTHCRWRWWGRSSEIRRTGGPFKTGATKWRKRLWAIDVQTVWVDHANQSLFSEGWRCADIHTVSEIQGLAGSFVGTQLFAYFLRAAKTRPRKRVCYFGTLLAVLRSSEPSAPYLPEGKEWRVFSWAHSALASARWRKTIKKTICIFDPELAQSLRTGGGSSVAIWAEAKKVSQVGAQLQRPQLHQPFLGVCCSQGFVHRSERVQFLNAFRCCGRRTSPCVHCWGGESIANMACMLHWHSWWLAMASQVWIG